MRQEPMPEFDTCIALDWSGATGRRYAGIAIAELDAAAAVPVLVPAPAGGWTRTAAVAWLEHRLGALRACGRRALVGIDCAFSLPETPVPGPELWARVEAAAAGAGDFFGGAYVDLPELAGRYWSRGTMPAGWVDRHRATELACRAAGLGAPQSPYKLIGARQVGKGALAGMRVLHHLKQALGDGVRVWPFEALCAGSVLVEIYPRLFLLQTGHGTTKVRSNADLNRSLERLGCRPQPAPVLAPVPNDHEADALVSAAGLRANAGRDELWRPQASADVLAREGWIWGVP